jgi:hypothetical protein
MKPAMAKPVSNCERGQLLVILPFAMIGLMLVSALAVDVSMAYVTKARLVKAADAAALVGMQNLSVLGQTQATASATNVFNANYPQTILDSSAPSVAINFSNNSGQQVVGAVATANIRTVFMGLIPAYKTLTVTATSQALRGYLAMTVVLDRSGSMTSNGGKAALQSAAPTFINYFSNTIDQVGMVSFGSNATTDFAVTSNFQTSINNKIASMNFAGATFGVGGLTVAKAQEDSVIPQQGQNLVKVVVYFTDGLVNTIQDTFACNSPLGNTLYNFGGYDSGSYYDFFNPSDGTDWSTACYNNRWMNGGCSDQYGTDNAGYPPHDATYDCRPVTKFYSQQYSQQQSFSRTNITAEAQYRALQTANALRAEGVYVYSIGLGSDPDQTFLKKIANDPSSPTYNQNQPEGLAVFAPDCPSSKCTAELQQVFQTIAAKILLRLVQ